MENIKQHINSQETLGYYGKGQVLFARKTYEQALIHYKKPAVIDPDFSLAIDQIAALTHFDAETKDGSSAILIGETLKEKVY